MGNFFNILNQKTKKERWLLDNQPLDKEWVRNENGNKYEITNRNEGS